MHTDLNDKQSAIDSKTLMEMLMNKTFLFQEVVFN